MLPVIMLILQFLGCRFYMRIDQLTTTRHLSNFFKHNRIMYSFMSILTPGKGSMILAEHSRYSFIIKLFEMICDQNTCVFFISFIDFFFCQVTYTWNLSINIICMCCTIAWNGSAGLSPAGCPLRMCVHDSSNIREFIIQNHMSGSIRRGIIFTFYFISIKVYYYHIFWS